MMIFSHSARKKFATYGVEKLKAQLAESDYKIIKCVEYQLVGKELPYDITVLHTERQALRDKINALEGD